MTSEIKISSPQALEKLIDQIKADVANKKLEVLFERGILEDGWCDTIDCCYFDYEQNEFKELVCETFHGSEGWYKTLEIEKSELNVILKKDWEYVFYNYESRIFILSVIMGGVGLYEVNYPLNIEEVKDYFENGQQSIEELNRRIQRKKSILSKRFARIQ